ncbi:MAG TPA: transketolase [Actinomycetes bacterium]|nr:transketolase [Actinomycetes bacterium]
MSTPHIGQSGSPQKGNSPVPWTDDDRRAVDTCRVLAMDAVQKVGNGHPGTAMSLAPAAYLLFQRHLRHDPAAPDWLGRDRFVLSMGHSSLTLYLQLYLSGYGLELDDLKALRTWGSLTPGHPEHGHTRGVETTTGPLGQGLSNGVGMAMAGRRVRGLLDPETAQGESPFDWTVWVFASDGDLQEGVSAEASSFAGTQRLGNLVVVWDDNHISIEDNTNIAFTEDVAERYRAYGWHVQELEPKSNGDIDVEQLNAAFTNAREQRDQPSFIRLRTHIAWPAPNAQDTGKAHGSALGAEEVAATKQVLGFDPTKSFDVDASVLRHAREIGVRGAKLRAAWQDRYDAWAAKEPERALLQQRLQSGKLPTDWDDDLPMFVTGDNVATRAASGKALAALGARLPELWGGSADLAGSNNTTIPGSPSALPEDRQTAMWQGGPFGRTLHFGVREHAMGAIANGIALEGHTRPYVGTFLVFSDYMRPSVRMAAIMGIPTIYVWTHDSIGVGEDGPTHQPIEHLAALRAIPNLSVVRPGDANETTAAWRATIEHRTGPVALALSRQNLPVLSGTDQRGMDGVAKGGYILVDGSRPTVDAIIMATGSELQLAVAAAVALEQDGTSTRVVSMPCMEWFAAQPESYRETVLPSRVRARVAVEAGSPLSWWRLVGDSGCVVGIDHFGASADAATLFEKFGFTSEAVSDAVRASIQLTGLRTEGESSR